MAPFSEGSVIEVVMKNSCDTCRDKVLTLGVTVYMISLSSSKMARAALSILA